MGAVGPDTMAVGGHSVPVLTFLPVIGPREYQAGEALVMDALALVMKDPEAEGFAIASGVMTKLFPSPQHFVDFMHDNDIVPELWTKGDACQFIIFKRNNQPPADHGNH